ncbi:molybdate-anion transporter-like [Tigriopus californicus]|uniref:molybdate-anion transporter-like n=1 Tax=Tigriopus californicus TaxID=6832 RepID=UPI0027DA4B97|nr:molybdate-anion transporter-like [Tigriopus californicus]
MSPSSVSNWLTMDTAFFGGFFVLAVIALIMNLRARNTDHQRQSVSNANFLTFQRSFFFVYFLALIGDWLQGPYVYKLYEYYGFRESQIAVLYVAGFGSSVVFGTATGPLADMIGRKKMAIVFCISYTICCLTKLSPNYWMLMFGRILGGISTSMLFSTFESWYVHEHTERYGFPAEWIGVTFSTTTFWNGFLAITAGVIANFTAEGLGYGPVAPFVVAVFPLVICGFVVARTWPENYGNRTHRLAASCMDGFKTILNDRKILYLGGVQTMVESCMYIFVFLWTPVLNPAHPPLGMVFACFMVAIMIGSSLYNLLLAKGYKAEEVLRLCLVIISLSMGVCSFTGGPKVSLSYTFVTYLAFLVLEVGIGIYFPAISYCKSQVIPESHRANVMNWFRVPMNVITCATLLCLHIPWISEDKRIVFVACFGLALSGVILATRFIATFQESKSNLIVDESKQSLIENGD